MLEQVSIIIPVAPAEKQHQQLLEILKGTKAEIIISSEGSRAKSLNQGAQKAQNPFLWFLHADSTITEDNINHLDQALKATPEALHYFNLAFDPPGLVSLNAWGANIRSRMCKLPYGDQGLCLSQAQFNTIGPYPEEAPYGEDVLFVRRAKRAGIQFNAIPSKLKTSARNYKTHGWAKLTLIRQGQLLKLLRHKL